MMEKGGVFLLLGNLLNSLFLSADKSINSLSQKWKLLYLIRYLIISSSLLLFHLFLSLPSSFLPFACKKYKHPHADVHLDVDTTTVGTSRDGGKGGGGGAAGSGIARALHQVLALVSTVPVTSRKYEFARGLVETLIEENLQVGLREVNCVAISEAFGRTLGELEGVLLEDGIVGGVGLVGVVKEWCGTRRMRKGGGGGDEGVSAEKMAAELVWLAEKLEACGGVEEAVEKWGRASRLGRLALGAQPRVQASLVKLTAFLIKQAKDMGREQGKGMQTQQQKQTNIKMLMAWLPLLCRASNGNDTPTLSTSKRAKIERALEEIIEMLEEEKNQEKVLSVWLHHFTQCPSSDWPNLYGSYTRWCSDSRKLMLTG